MTSTATEENAGLKGGDRGRPEGGGDEAPWNKSERRSGGGSRSSSSSGAGGDRQTGRQPTRPRSGEPWDALGLKMSGSRAYSGHTKAVNSCLFSEDGGTLASASDDGTVRLWAMDEGSEAHRERVATIVCGSAAKSIAWDMKTDRMLLIGTQQGQVRAWDADAKRMVFDVPVQLPIVRGMAVYPDGSSFVALSIDASSARSAMQSFSMRDGRESQAFTVGEGVCMTCVKMNHNGSLIATGATDGRVRLFDVRAGASIMSWQAHEGAASSLHFCRDETSIMTAGADGMLHEWSAHVQGRLMTSLKLTSSAGQGDVESAGGGAAGRNVLDSASSLSPCGRFASVCSGRDPYALIIPMSDAENRNRVQLPIRSGPPFRLEGWGLIIEGRAQGWVPKSGPASK